VGSIAGSRFEVGINRLPVVGDSVTIPLEKHIQIALSPIKERFSISIGRFPDSEFAVYLDLDHLLGKHTAVVGTTGCGKSYAVAKMLNEFVNHYPSSNIIVFDLHGEYRTCFKSCNYIRADKISLPAWLYSFEDLFDLCADLSNQFNIHNQRLVFRDGIFRVKQRYCREIIKDDKLAENIDLDAPIPFNFDHVINYLHNINNETVKKDSDEPAIKGDKKDQLKDRIEYEKYVPRGMTIGKGALMGELDRLVLRVESRRKDPRYSFMFNYPEPEKGDLEKLLEDVTGLKRSNPKNITVFDLSYLPSETVGSVVATISRMIFQVHFLSERRKNVPSLIVYEEAHNYISRHGKGAYGEARQSVERIAKEGRKFGVGTIVVSQRPSELSETLLSQCNTYLCMRLGNKLDKGYIESFLPDSMNRLIDILPALPRGHVLAIGQATKMPVRFVVSEIEDKNMCPDSDDPPFGEKWGVEIEKRQIPDLSKVCSHWIRSEKPD
jgi:DNA helicase HerA-like ATPase